MDMVHAQERQIQRKITRPEYTYVLRHGYHEARKDTFEEPYNACNYAIRGKTLDKRDLQYLTILVEGNQKLGAADADLRHWCSDHHGVGTDVGHRAADEAKGSIDD